MSGWLFIGFSLAAGSLIGLFYFGGLWLTVQALPRAGNPAVLLLASFLGRTAVSLSAFYWIMDGRWERLLAAMAGFLIARYFLTQRYGPPGVESEK
jgi:F1F0 ATPase subunit 2